MNQILSCFPQGKTKALTLSYDDGKLDDLDFIALLNKYAVPCTFNINSGLLGKDAGWGMHVSEADISTLYKNHEAAVHTLTHPTLPRCSNETIISEIMEDRKNLERLTGKTVRGMAYPNRDGWTNEIKQLLPFLGIDYARVTGCTGNFLIPKDFYEWQFTCDHNHNLIELAQEFLALSKPQYLHLMSVYGHSWDIVKDNAMGKFEEFLQLISKKTDIWYVLNIEFIDYMNALKRLRFSADMSFVENPNAISLWLSVNGKTIEIPGGQRVRF
jgi:peptidoglycan/xylan/chitin deacetylase (PgdA/CDA1 family)